MVKLILASLLEVIYCSLDTYHFTEHGACPPGVCFTRLSLRQNKRNEGLTTLKRKTGEEKNKTAYNNLIGVYKESQQVYRGLQIMQFERGIIKCQSCSLGSIHLPFISPLIQCRATGTGAYPSCQSAEAGEHPA